MHRTRSDKFEEVWKQSIGRYDIVWRGDDDKSLKEHPSRGAHRFQVPHFATSSVLYYFHVLFHLNDLNVSAFAGSFQLLMIRH